MASFESRYPSTPWQGGCKERIIMSLNVCSISNKKKLELPGTFFLWEIQDKWENGAVLRQQNWLGFKSHQLQTIFLNFLINPHSDGHPGTLNTDGLLDNLPTKTWTNTPKVVREAYQYDAKHLPPPPASTWPYISPLYYENPQWRKKSRLRLRRDC